MLRYLVSGMKNEQKEVLIETLNKTLQGGQIMTTIAESWFEEGKIEGKFINAIFVDYCFQTQSQLFFHLCPND